MCIYDNYSDNQLLKLIVAERSNENVIDNLTNTIPLQELLTNTEEAQLLNIKGITPKKAEKILAMNTLIKRLYSRNYSNGYKITQPEDAANLVMPEIRFLKQEVLKVILLNTKNVVVDVVTTSVGTLNSSLVSPMETYRPAVKSGTNSIIICHNHPSGDPTPSNQDIDVTRRLNECGKLLNISLLDHIIIGDGTYVSLKQKGII